MSPSKNSLFEAAAREIRNQGAPLADRMRPRTLDEYVGQKELIGDGTLLNNLFHSQFNKTPDDSPTGPFPSLIFWGPPGTGKTTLARLIASSIKAVFEAFSAVESGVKDARAVMNRARDRLAMEHKRTILFVDEIHRFNRAQQDAFLSAVEDGTISLLGATTENPSFEVNSALLSRCRVCILKQLTFEDLEQLIDRALSDTDRGLGKENVQIEDEAKQALCKLSGGDARTLLNGLELAALAAAPTDGNKKISKELIFEALQRNTILYDASGEEHFNIISAFHKSIRSSDPQASLYYLARMLEGGEDPKYIARRLIRIASEDIGLADPQAAVQTMAAKDAVEFVGLPECDSALAQATIYLACAPKSNTVYKAVKFARSEVKETGPLPIPLHLRNAPTQLMKDVGYGKNYQYDHDSSDAFSGQKCLPEGTQENEFYSPGDFGFEKDIQKRMDYFNKLRNQKNT